MVSGVLLMLRMSLGCCAFSILLGSHASFAADANNGKALADRWCSSCHVVDHEQKLATDQAPPFASIARIPNFDANRLTFLLLKPHPSMPKLELSRVEALDLADYIATLK
jgi:mono/diheme cytochrome c family protein